MSGRTAVEQRCTETASCRASPSSKRKRGKPTTAHTAPLTSFAFLISHAALGLSTYKLVPLLTRRHHFRTCSAPITQPPRALCVAKCGGFCRCSAWKIGGGVSENAKDSVVLDLEWEPVSELENRVREGAKYEPWSGSDEARRRQREDAGFKDQDDGGGGMVDEPAVLGVFCGFVLTKEERSRLRSADPSDSLNDNDDYSI